MFTSSQRVLSLLLLTLGISAAAQQPEKVQLTLRAVVGQAMTYRVEGNLSVEAGGGRRVPVEIRTAEQGKITAVAANGEITRESQYTEYKLSFAGRATPTPDEILKSKDIVVERPDGSLVSSRTEGSATPETPEDKKESRRMDQASRVLFSPQPVGVGDKWTHEFKEDAQLSSVPGIAEFEVVAFEKAKGIDCVKLKTSYRETTGDRKLTSSGDVWIEKTSGDTVLTDLKMENILFGPAQGRPVISGSFRYERTAGSPMGLQGPDPQGTTAAPPKKEKSIDDVVKDYEKLSGLFTLYRKKESARDTLYLEVREDQLNRLLFLQATASTGVASQALAAGSPLNDILFRLQVRDEQVLMVVPNQYYLVDDKKPIARSVRRSFADAYLESFQIEGRSSERKSLLINVTDLFRGDLAQITQAAAAAGGAFAIDRAKTYFSAVKLFPDNLLIQTAYHLSRAGGGGIPGVGGAGFGQADPRSLPLGVNYNLWVLPENGYRPRLADPRVGYFTTDFQDLSTDADDTMKRFLFRWQLQKQDPRAELSPPKKPIEFWLDNAIPVEYRDAVRKGLLVWNGALEKVGFKDAIVVKQMPDDADWDHADMRHNVIRWVSSPSNGYAVAQFRVNPLTGQILNAGITVDANMTRFGKTEFVRAVDPLAALKEPDPDPTQLARDRFALRCNYAEQGLQNAWFGLTAMNLLAGPGSTRIPEKQYVDDYVTHVVAHEMGHIMGLRHNFIASTYNGIQELKQGDRLRQSGVVGSVMDYTPFNQMALHSPNSVYWGTALGPYDYWAIQYGYTEVPGVKSYDEELPRLKMIASQCNRPGLAYLSDENADQWDPLVTRFDLCRDPLQYYTVLFEDARRLANVLPSRFPKQGESYYELTRSFNGVLGMYSRSARQVSRYVGGLNLRRNHRGDFGERLPLQPISATDQRRALGLLRSFVFARDAFPFPKQILQKLAPDPNPDLLSVLLGGGRQDAPVRDTLSSLQTLTLSRLFAPATLNRMSNNEFKAPGAAGTLTLAELFGSVSNAIWEEPRMRLPVDGLRRTLQRAYVQTLGDLTLRTDSNTPDDARMLARYHLRQARTQLQTALRASRDEYTRIHYTEAVADIDRFLEARLTVGPATPASTATGRRFGVE